ncbi:MAG: hypothetical protein UT01_C0062G0006 [Candidatus Daviesbacteria bacterium GW2011_GWA1_38_7]|nr:MAG: hypothetical protein UT01_C0062G0006 [Candidatus Daviesbacteria bacterium GW2011_GWA1_38_7]
MQKKGSILAENIIFIILNLTFIIILMLFLFSKTGAAPVMEEKYAKQIAMLVDTSEPVMTIDINMEDAIEIAQKENMNLNEAIAINGNIVTVKLRPDSNGYSYSFFNDVDAKANFDTKTRTKYYLTITKNE